MSKTPQFDKILSEYFSTLPLGEKGGQWRTCRLSGKKFYVRSEDISFYKKMGVPLPSLNPYERTRRKLAFMNIYNLFRVTSAISGKSIIAEYPPSTKYKIYEHQIFFGDGRNGEEYGLSYDDSKTVFDQIEELKLKVPRPNLDVDTSCVNSDFSNFSTHLKNCYLVFDSVNSEDCVCSCGMIDSRLCFDSFGLQNCQICYDSFESRGLYNCFFVGYSKNCLDSFFLFDCRNCNNCFGSTNLRNKKYCFFNQQLTKQDYELKIKNLNLGDFDVLSKIKEEFKKLKTKAIYKQDHNNSCLDCSGDYLEHSKNCYGCFYVFHSENVSYSIGGMKNRDAYDLVGGMGTEFSYDTYGGINNYKVKFSVDVDSSRNMEYCDLCVNCHDCFGSIGLKNKSFCIFNQRYSEEEYWKLLDIVKTKMFKDGSYGEFFPPNLSPFPYNISLATSYSGYDDIVLAKKYGYNFEEIKEVAPSITEQIIDSLNLPKDIVDVTNDILNSVIFDSTNQKYFRIIKSELDFYRQHNLPLPRLNPFARLSEKRKRFGTIVFELYDRSCPQCKKSFQSPYTTDRSEIVYCEACYQQEVV